MGSEYGSVPALGYAGQLPVAGWAPWSAAAETADGTGTWAGATVSGDTLASGALASGVPDGRPAIGSSATGRSVRAGLVCWASAGWSACGSSATGRSVRA